MGQQKQDCIITVLFEIKKQMQIINQTKSQVSSSPQRITRKTGRKTLRTNSISSNQSKQKLILQDIISRRSSFKSQGQQSLAQRPGKLSRSFQNVDDQVKYSKNSYLNNIKDIQKYYVNESYNQKGASISLQASRMSKQKTIFQEKRWFRDQSIHKTKQIRKLTAINQNLQRANQQLNKAIQSKDTQIKQLCNRINFLSKQILTKGKLLGDLKIKVKKQNSDINTQHNQRRIDLIQSKSSNRQGFIDQHQAKNPFKKLKQIRKFTLNENNNVKVSSIFSNCASEKSLDTMVSFRSQRLIESVIFPVKQDHQLAKISSFLQNPEQKEDENIELEYLRNYRKQMQDRYINIQKDLFRSMQKIKGLTIQLDVIKRKHYEEIQSEKKKKVIQYSQLKNKFSELLSKYTDLLKQKRKKQISSKLKGKRQSISKEFLQYGKQPEKQKHSLTFDTSLSSIRQFKQLHSDHQLSHFELSSDEN